MVWWLFGRGDKGSGSAQDPADPPGQDPPVSGGSERTGGGGGVSGGGGRWTAGGDPPLQPDSLKLGTLTQLVRSVLKAVADAQADADQAALDRFNQSAPTDYLGLPQSVPTIDAVSLKLAFAFVPGGMRMGDQVGLGAQEVESQAQSLLATDRAHPVPQEWLERVVSKFTAEGLHQLRDALKRIRADDLDAHTLHDLDQIMQGLKQKAIRHWIAKQLLARLRKTQSVWAGADAEGEEMVGRLTRQAQRDLVYLARVHPDLGAFIAAPEESEDEDRPTEIVFRPDLSVPAPPCAADRPAGFAAAAAPGFAGLPTLPISVDSALLARLPAGTVQTLDLTVGMRDLTGAETADDISAKEPGDLEDG